MHFYPFSELKESIARVGADIKQRIIDSIKSTWNTINDFAKAHKSIDGQTLEQHVDSEMSSVVQQMVDDDTGCKNGFSRAAAQQKPKIWRAPSEDSN